MPEQTELLEKYNRRLVEKNKVFNLTAHKTFEDSWTANICDSLLFCEYFRNITKSNIKVLDLGSGGGCPAVPLKIMCTNINMIMIDGTRKKVNFLNEIVTELGLEGISAIHTRIEGYAATNRDVFDIITARAVAALPTLLEYALPMLKVDGVLLAYKGKNWQTEIVDSNRALEVLGGKVIETLVDNLEGKERVLIVVRKIHITDKKYPRGGNLALLKPL